MNNTLIQCGTILLVVLIITIGGCNIRVDNHIAKAIKNGADPVIARLAFENGGGREQRFVYLGKLKQ